MKYLYQSKLLTFVKSEPHDVESIVKYKYFYKHRLLDTHIITNNEQNYKDDTPIQIQKSIYLSKEINVFKNRDLLGNTNVLMNKLICYCMVRGLKLKAYNTYNIYINIFFSFFREYNRELALNYNLYPLYYEYAHKHKQKFFSPVFVYDDIASFLEPTFILTVKKIKKKKKKMVKEYTITYLKSSKRLPFCLKLVNLYSKSYKYKDVALSKCYGLLNTFLNNRNSELYKKKVYAYTKLLNQKKT